MNLKEGSSIQLKETDFYNKILFFEDIPEVCDVEYMGNFFDWLGRNGYLQILRGVIIGKMSCSNNFRLYADRIREVVSERYELTDLPILYGLNFGHASPIFMLPYDAEAELDIDNLKFAILESGVVNKQ